MSTEANKKEDDIKKNLKKAHQYWNNWKLQIHWNKLDWVVTKSRKVKKCFYIFPQVLYKI